MTERSPLVPILIDLTRDERNATLRHIGLALAIAEAGATSAHNHELRMRCVSVAAILNVLMDDIRFERHITQA